MEFSSQTGPAPRVEVERVETIGEYVVETRIVIEGMDAEALAAAVRQAIRLAERDDGPEAT